MTFHNRYIEDRFSYFLAIYCSRNGSWQTVKDLQAQTAQFQEMVTNLVQGQEDLKKVITRKKKVIGVLNMGRRHKGGPKVVSQLEILDKSG